MPFTPYHMGPGCAIKAALGRHFSLMVFGFAQVLIDIEVLIHILRRDHDWHGFCHTYLGATGVAIVAVVLGRPVCQVLISYWPTGTGYGWRFSDWLRGPARITWPAAISGAFIGTYSHVFLDCFMHSDVKPFWPLTHENHLLGLFSVPELYLICIWAGIAGCLGIVGVYFAFRPFRGKGEAKNV
jgi:hypothetical protein